MKTIAPKLPSTRRSVGPGRSRFAQFDPLLLELHKKYPSRSGRNINFLKAFEEDPGLHGQLNGEDITALRSRASDVIEKHLATGNGGSAQVRVSKRKASRFAAHDDLLRELFKKFPTESGKCVSFQDAFKADPSLRQKLGIKTIQDMHSCEQHARKMLGTSTKVKRKKAAKQLAVIPEAPAAAAPMAAAEPPAPMVNFCWNCGEPQPSKALALMHRMARR